MHVPVRAPRLPSVTLALSLTAGLLYRATPRPPAATAAPHAAPAADGTRLSAAQASLEARASGQAVVADALTTETSQTTASADASFTLTTTRTPVRVQRAGAW